MKKGTFLKWLEKRGLVYKNTPTKKRPDAITIYSPRMNGDYIRVSGFGGDLVRATSYGRFSGTVTGRVCRDMILAMAC